MDYRKSLLIVATVMMVLFSSCASVNKTATQVKGISLVPDITRLELKADDIEYLGDVEISYEMRRYLLIFKILDSVNDQNVSPRVIESAKLIGYSGISMNKNMQRAASKAIIDYPDADFFVPVYNSRKIDKMFMGRKINETMLMRAYKLKK